MRYVGMPSIPRDVSSRVTASSPETRSDSSWLMISAATFLPAKLTSAAAGVFQTEVIFGLAPSRATALTSTRARQAILRIRRLYSTSRFPCLSRAPITR